MYQIYNTEGLILRSFSFGEADGSYLILTKDFGLIRAEARGIRKLDSKLRCFLQDFSLALFSFVRGKEKWRITTVSKHRNFFADLSGRLEERVVLIRIALLISRLVKGEEKNQELFEHVKDAFDFLANKTFPDILFLRNIECLAVLRILHSLGYVGSTPDLDFFIANRFFGPDLIMKIGKIRPKVIQTINSSLKESHL